MNTTSPQCDGLQPTSASAEPRTVAGDTIACQPWLVATQNWLRSTSELFGGKGRRVFLSNQDLQVCVLVARGQVQHPGIGKWRLVSDRFSPFGSGFTQHLLSQGCPEPPETHPHPRQDPAAV